VKEKLLSYIDKLSLEKQFSLCLASNRGDYEKGFIHLKDISPLDTQAVFHRGQWDFKNK